MAKLNSLEQVRALIDDIDGVAFGKVPDLLNEMAILCDKALSERDEMFDALRLVACAQTKFDASVALDVAQNVFAQVRA